MPTVIVRQTISRSGTVASNTFIKRHKRFYCSMASTLYMLNSRPNKFQVDTEKSFKQNLFRRHPVIPFVCSVLCTIISRVDHLVPSTDVTLTTNTAVLPAPEQEMR